jgi:hypothetical protein
VDNFDYGCARNARHYLTLEKALLLRRTELRFPDALSWNRAWLSCRFYGSNGRTDK